MVFFFYQLLTIAGPQDAKDKQPEKPQDAECPLVPLPDILASKVDIIV